MQDETRHRETLRAREDEVHVWRVGLNPPPAALGVCRAFLSPDEIARMQRYHFDVHRRRFCAGRGILRSLLGRYLDLPPSRVAFTYGAQGKPALASSDPEGDTARGDVRFNVSHSADEALIAVGLGRDLGIDIEGVKPGLDPEKIARRFFSPREVERLLACSGDQRVGAFFECWTRKESFVKACGGGLQLPLDGFDVAFGPGVAAGLLRVDWDARAVAAWTLLSLDVAEGFRGALTVAGRGFSLRYRDAADLDRTSTRSRLPDIANGGWNNETTTT